MIKEEASFGVTERVINQKQAEIMMGKREKEREKERKPPLRYCAYIWFTKQIRIVE
jgi:hypothetical protein